MYVHEDEVARRALILWLFENYGLDAKAMKRDNWDEDGYFWFQLDALGRVQFDTNGDPICQWRRWPAGFDFNKFTDLIAATRFG